MTQNFTEKRKYHRKEMFLVMEVEKNQHPRQKLNVITNNISAGGVYFKTPYNKDFQVGNDVSFTIFISVPIPKGISHPSQIEGSGRIVRSEVLPDAAVNDSWSGIALEFDQPLNMH